MSRGFVSNKYMPKREGRQGFLGLVERHLWGWLLGSWVIGIPLRLFSPGVSGFVLADVVFAVGVILFVMAFFLRRSTRRKNAPAES